MHQMARSLYPVLHQVFLHPCHLLAIHSAKCATNQLIWHQRAFYRVQNWFSLLAMAFSMIIHKLVWETTIGNKNRIVYTHQRHFRLCGRGTSSILCRNTRVSHTRISSSQSEKLNQKIQPAWVPIQLTRPEAVQNAPPSLLPVQPEF